MKSDKAEKDASSLCSLVGTIDSKFLTLPRYSAKSQREATVGLVSLDEMKALHHPHTKQAKSSVSAVVTSCTIDGQAGTNQENAEERSHVAVPSKRRKQSNSEGGGARKGLTTTTNSRLSFSLDEATEEDGSENPLCLKMRKNPEVDTSFLPDRDREEEERQLKEQLMREWKERNLRLKEEEILLTYAYWDGSGHRKTCQLKKGNTIQQFLQKTVVDLRSEFLDLRAVSADQLMFIKDDLILPHHYSFYDFIVKKARGRSGLLFHFDFCLDEKGVLTSEKPEVVPGKVCLRSWYDKNKHIFPCNRWEPYDPYRKWGKQAFTQDST